MWWSILPLQQWEGCPLAKRTGVNWLTTSAPGPSNFWQFAKKSPFAGGGRHPRESGAWTLSSHSRKEA